MKSDDIGLGASQLKLNKEIELDITTIVVSGATGFVGRHLVFELTKNGYSVISLVRNLDKAKGIPQLKKSSLQQFDITKVDSQQDFPKNSILIHCAWDDARDSLNMKHIEEHFSTNYRFIKNAVSHGIKKVFVTGTCYEYGLKYGPVSSHTPTNPNTPYALAKVTLHKSLCHLQKTNDFQLIWLRLFYMYGEGQNENSIISLFDKALENGDLTFNMSFGEQLCDYLPIEEVAKKIYALLNEVEGTFNICSGKPISLRRLLEQRMLKKNKAIELNLGHYEYRTKDTLAIWGSNQI